MKGIGVLFVLALLGFTVFNYCQTQLLRAEVAELRAQIAQQEADGLTDELIARATTAILQAKTAMSSAKLDNAKAALNTAKEYLADAQKNAGEHAGPRLKWLQEQAQAVGRQVQERVNR